MAYVGNISRFKDSTLADNFLLPTVKTGTALGYMAQALVVLASISLQHGADAEEARSCATETRRIRWASCSISSAQDRRFDYDSHGPGLVFIEAEVALSPFSLAKPFPLVRRGCPGARPPRLVSLAPAQYHQ